MFKLYFQESEPSKRKVEASSENQQQKVFKTSQEHNVFICEDPNCDDCKLESVEVQKDHDYTMNTEGHEPMESNIVDEFPDEQKESDEEQCFPDLTYGVTEEVTVKSCIHCEDLENCIHKLKKDHKEEIDRIKEEHNEIITELKSKIAMLEGQVQDLSKPWNPDQVKKISLPEGSKISRWSDLTIKAAIDLYYSMGSTSYNKLLAKGMPYPSLRTIRRHLARVDFNPGTLYHIMELIRNHKVKALPEKGRFGSMSSDELSLQDRREYDPTTQSIVGAPTMPLGDKLIERKIKQGENIADVLATKGNNAMICGIQSRWKQVCGFHFTGDSFNAQACAEWHKDMIIEAKKSMLTIKSLCLDMGSDNIAM